MFFWTASEIKQLLKQSVRSGGDLKSNNILYTKPHFKRTTKRISDSVRAGLQFPVGRVRRYLRKGRFANRIGKTAPVYLATVLEYLTAELLEVAGNQARDDNKKIISEDHLLLAISKDKALNKLFNDQS